MSGPNIVEVSPEFVQVAAGAHQTCGLRGDLDSEQLPGSTIRCWGDDGDGQVTGMNTRSPADVVQVAGSIEADRNFLCALSVDGTVNCWGNDDHGQISGLDLLARE